MDRLEKLAEGIVEKLSGEIGARPSGSPGCQAAAQYITDQMERIGLQVEEQSYSVPGWSCDEAVLSVGSDFFEVLANPFSPSCEVRTSLVTAASLAELEEVEIAGRIAVLYGDLTRAPLAAKSWFLKEERDERIVALLEQKKPAAVLTVQVKPGSTDRLIEDWEFKYPSATLPAESALALLARPEVEAKLRISTRSFVSKSANLIGFYPGRREERIVLCAHYDTKIDTPGAGDNAAGVAALLCAAEVLNKVHLNAGLEVIVFSNEEYLPIGEEAYIRAFGEEHFSRILFAINFDGLGHRLDSNTIASFACSSEFQRAVEKKVGTFPSVVWTDPWPQSNHSSFAMRGVPALALSSRALWLTSHQRDDTARWISPAKVTEAACLAASVVQGLSSKPLAWARPSNPAAG